MAAASAAASSLTWSAWQPGPGWTSSGPAGGATPTGPDPTGRNQDRSQLKGATNGMSLIAAGPSAQVGGLEAEALGPAAVAAGQPEAILGDAVLRARQRQPVVLAGPQLHVPGVGQLELAAVDALDL